MAGRGGGRGRGRGGGGFLAGLGDRELPLPPTLKPPPTYPPLARSALPLPMAKPMHLHLIMRRREYLKTLRTSPYYFEIDKEKSNDVVRYSDKYKPKKASTQLDIDWTRLPNELRMPKDMVKRKVKKGGRGGNKKVPKSPPRLLLDKSTDLGKSDAKDVVDGEEKEDKEDGSEEDGSEQSEEEVEDDENVESNDYCVTYFDNGEGEVDEEEDGLDEGGGEFY